MWFFFTGQVNSCTSVPPNYTSNITSHFQQCERALSFSTLAYQAQNNVGGTSPTYDKLQDINFDKQKLEYINIYLFLNELKKKYYWLAWK